jgi:tRNA(Ile2) C34 agmatinyltransferase TiaS
MTYRPPERPHICPDCGGRSLNCKGSVHGWRCNACVDAAIGYDPKNSRSPFPVETGTSRVDLAMGRAREVPSQSTRNHSLRRQTA